MIVDTHSHLNFNAFKNDSEEVIKRTLDDNIWFINVGTKYETSKKAVEIAEKYGEGVYSAIGLHPIYAGAEFMKAKTDPDEGEFLIHPHTNLKDDFNIILAKSEATSPVVNNTTNLIGKIGVGVKEQDFDKKKYKELAKSKKVVAIGEIGLDYYYKPKTTAKLALFKEKQKKIFLEQLDLAKELNLPVILHCRMAHDDVIEILNSKFYILNYHPGGVIHCFTGTLEQAQKYIAMGFYIGINGIIFKFNIDEVIKNISLDKIVVETDCPYLTPVPEGTKRNEPIFIKHTIQKIADLKSISFDEVCQRTTQNAKKLFKI